MSAFASQSNPSQGLGEVLGEGQAEGSGPGEEEPIFLKTIRLHSSIRNVPPRGGSAICEVREWDISFSLSLVLTIVARLRTILLSLVERIVNKFLIKMSLPLKRPFHHHHLLHHLHRPRLSLLSTRVFTVMCQCLVVVMPWWDMDHTSSYLVGLISLKRQPTTIFTYLTQVVLFVSLTCLFVV